MSMFQSPLEPGKETIVKLLPCEGTASLIFTTDERTGWLLVVLV